jgi:hypothetical protein
MTLDLPDDLVFRRMGFDVHHWTMPEGYEATALQKEPFRLEWFLTQVVTYVFFIDGERTTIERVQRDFDPLFAFAKAHKRTPLPRGLQCGYALLPIYLGTSFDDELRRHVRAVPKKRWCVSHVPTLFDLETRRLDTVTRTSMWGRMYADYIYRTIAETTQVLVADATIEA